MPSRSWSTSTCPSVVGPAPIPITGISMRSMIRPATAAGIASKTSAKQPARCSSSASSSTARARSAVRPWAR